MIKVIGCIVQQHDLRLVILAAAICCLACVTALNMLSRTASHSGRPHVAWLAGAVLVFGFGVWATHFVAMLAYLSSLVIGYAPAATALSLAAVWCGTAGAFWLAISHRARRPSAPFAGLLLGCGISAMHYIGISAMSVQGFKSFDPGYVFASIAACCVLSYAGLRNLHALQDVRLRLIGAGFLTAGIVVLHFTAMTALTLQPAAVELPAAVLIKSSLLATIVVTVSIVIIALSLFGSIVDQHLSRRLALEASNLYHLAHHDALTGLPNRLQCLERLAALVETAADAEHGVAVLCLDLDRFKQVNDLLGHRAGDQLLIQVGARLQALVRSDDLVARTGGDEFVIAITAPATAAAAAALAERVVDTLLEPFSVEGQQVGIGTSVGLALSPGDGTTGDDLLRNADAALYQAKKEGRGTYRFFEPAMSERLRQRQILEQDLRQGIRDGQLELYYQPILDVRTKAVVSFEALVRWQHPTQGLIAPGDFIGLAEESGLIIDLGRWVLETACREAASWHTPLRVAVNLSPVQFRQTDLAAVIEDILSRTRLQPDRLELEVTESVLIRHAEQAVETLNRLRDLGVNISLDDFGTGYSSLSYLRRFPFNKIKLDRSFVQSLGEDEEAAVITRAIVALGHSLRLTVTAEGVETDEQLGFLQGQDCNQVQGFLFGKPVPAIGIAHLTRHHLVGTAG